MKRVSKLLACLLAVCVLSACGSQYSSMEQGVSTNNANKGGLSFNATAGAAAESISGGNNYSYDDTIADSDYESDTSDAQGQGGAEIQKDMLVYRGSVTVNTKEYDSTIASLNELLEKYDCFIQDSQEGMNYRYYDNSDGLMYYQATVRVNSAVYSEFMNSIGDLGVVTSKSSNVQNMNMEYSDTVTSLRIQNARLERYLKRLETETDSEVALQLEREITNIQIEVQQLEARKALIETDVAYSYVDINLREVRAYTSQVTYQDPLHVRLWAEVVNTYYEFTEFLVSVVIFFIHAFPYLVIIGVVLFVLRKKFHWKFKMPKFNLKLKKLGKKSNEDDKES